MQATTTSKDAWFDLVRTSPRAAALLHVLTENMGGHSAVVASRTTLAALTKCSDATTKRAIATLKDSGWVQVVQLGGKGGVNAYVVNKPVVWDSDNSLMTTSFTVNVLTTLEEQGVVERSDLPLKKIPARYAEQ